MISFDLNDIGLISECGIANREESLLPHPARIYGFALMICKILFYEIKYNYTNLRLNKILTTPNILSHFENELLFPNFL